MPTTLTNDSRFQERRTLEQMLEERLASLRVSGDDLPFLEKIEYTNNLLQLEDGLITEEIRQRARWIVDWAIQKTRSADSEPPESPGAQDGERVRELLFSYSPCVFSYLPLPDQISVLARGSRVEALQGALVQPFLGEVIQQLSFAKSPKNILQESWSKTSLSDKLDFIDFAPTLFAQANAQGGRAFVCAEAVEQFLATVREQEESFFVQMLASEARSRIEAETIQPTAGAVLRMGDQRVGRMQVDQVSLKAENVALKRKIFLEQGAGYTLRRVSRDAVGAFDHAAIPQRYISLSQQEEALLPESMVDTNALEQVERRLSHSASRFRPQVKWECLMTIQQKLLPPAEATGAAWEMRLPILSADQWDAYWSLEQEQQGLADEIHRLQALPETGEEEKARLKQNMWKSAQIDEALQPLSDLIYRDPTLHRVMVALVRAVPHLEPIQSVPFEQFEENRRLMPKGEKREIEASVLLQVMHRPGVREKLEERIGLSLNILSLREQIQFLSFLAQADSKKQQQVFQLMKEFGVVAARSFLSCEYDPQMGEVILGLAEERQPSEVKRVLDQYSALVEQVAVSSETLHAQFYSGTEGKPISREVFEDSLLARAKQLLTRAAKEKEVAMERVLEGYTEDLSVFVSLFKSVFKGTHVRVPFEAIRGLSIESVSLRQLDPEKRRSLYEELRPLVEENWTRPDTAAGPGVLKRFQEVFTNEQKDSTFFLLRREAEIVACVRFDARPDLGETAVYAGSLNVSKSFQDSGIGGAFVREMVEYQIGEKELYADVLAADAVGSFYVEELGCVIDGVKRPVEGGGPFFSLHRSKELNRQLKTKNEQIHLVGEGKVSAAFDLPAQKETFLGWVEAVTREKQLVTHYQISRGTAGSERRFLMAEPAPVRQTTSASLSKAA